MSRAARTSLILAVLAMASVYGVRAITGKAPWVSWPDVARQLHPIVTSLAQEGVRAYRAQGWCQFLADAHGEAMASDHPTTCGLTASDSSPPFDEASRARFERVGRQLDTVSLDLLWVTVTATTGGALMSAEVAIDACPICRSSLYYHAPGQAAPEDQGSEIRYRALGDGWYLVDEDWM